MLPAQKNAIIYRILSGEMEGNDELADRLSVLGIKLNERLYAVIIASFNDANASSSLHTVNACKVLFKELLQGSGLSVLGTYDIDIDKVTVIIYSPGDNIKLFVDEIDAFARRVGAELSSVVRVSVSFSGSMTEDVSMIHATYHEARIALDYIHPDKKYSVLWYKGNEENNNSYFYYPLDKEIELITSVLKGNVLNCRVALSSIYKVNFIRSALSQSNGIQFLNCLVSSLFRLCEGLQNKREAIHEYLQGFTDSIGESMDIKQKYSELREFILNLCMEIHVTQYKQKGCMIEQVIEYIENNFQDYQISLASVASIFGVTENYLSRFFKEQTNENFSKYIERLRMDMAHDLITKQKRSVSETAAMVGYIYPQVFRRVYKRCFGINPSESMKDR